MLSGGYCPGGYCPGGYCPDTIPNTLFPCLPTPSPTSRPLGETSPGLDELPAWFLRAMAPFISLPIHHLFNECIRESFIPKQWKAAIITPVPKVQKPTSCQEYRPISVTPILSRLFEKLVVQKFLYPVLGK